MCSTLHIFHCVIPENIHTSPMEGGFSNTSPTPWKFQLSFIHFYKLFGLIEPLTPQEIPILSVGGVWIFSGRAHYVIRTHSVSTPCPKFIFSCVNDVLTVSPLFNVVQLQRFLMKLGQSHIGWDRERFIFMCRFTVFC